MAFVIAQVAGVISQVPGGIGVFESAFLWLMADIDATDQHLALISALLQYRVIYYFLPLLLAGAGLLGYEISQRKQAIITGSTQLGKILGGILPPLYSLLLLLAGSILLMSGSIPTNPKILGTLQNLLPLPIVEFSHLTGSLVGLLLLFIARGIRLRIDAAWYGSVVLLSLGIAASLLKGFNWHEALVLLIILLLMLPTYHHFQRHSSLMQISFSRRWTLMTTMALTASVWLGFFAYRDVQYSHNLWWQFSFEGDAPRFLRALLIMSIIAMGLALYRLFSIEVPVALTKPSEQELNAANILICQAKDTNGHLALIGDKYLSWSDDKSAFIMFATTKKYWIAMGDPVGNANAFENLLWAFREQAYLYGADVVFYQVSGELLPYYLDLGFSLIKLGEEAKIDVPGFHLTGRKRDSQRGAHNRFGKQGFSFDILAGAQIETALPRLREISDAWLKLKGTQEKGFSLGYFDEAYLRRTDIAVIRAPNGNIVAFANLWQTLCKQELSIDLMRYDPNISGGVMEFLLIELILWAQQQNYQWFSLGMAPLSGLERRPLAPLWHKLGAIVFDLGDELYNFEGLRNYKAKFGPVWLPRYLAAPSEFSVPFIMMAVTRLIAGSWKGVITK